MLCCAAVPALAQRGGGVGHAAGGVYGGGPALGRTFGAGLHPGGPALGLSGMARFPGVPYNARPVFRPYPSGLGTRLPGYGRPGLGFGLGTGRYPYHRPYRYNGPRAFAPVYIPAPLVGFGYGVPWDVSEVLGYGVPTYAEGTDYADGAGYFSYPEGSGYPDASGYPGTPDYPAGSEAPFPDPAINSGSAPAGAAPAGDPYAGASAYGSPYAEPGQPVPPLSPDGSQPMVYAPYVYGYAAPPQVTVVTLPAPMREEDAVTIFYRDGRPPEQIRNYALTRSALLVTGPRLREIPLQDIDLDLTERVNRAAGVEFQLPRPR